LDVPPYCLASGDRARLYGLNLIGLKRRGFQPAQVAAIEKAYRTLFIEGLALRDALAQICQEYPSSPEVAHLAEFIAGSQRGICRPRGHADPEGEAEPF
ncbi:MAG TPA: acyl-[acyl-carrier-protein]--UDP-N-acetylglucosamine O-acyltransferase, partial [Candidatus Binatia bacterium]|nr:acyl-[acyl-carrier-protein]--UDP-N-acetylglucosamine O-acyltransferase [Candidatus Binatia bacterium]